MDLGIPARPGDQAESSLHGAQQTAAAAIIRVFSQDLDATGHIVGAQGAPRGASLCEHAQGVLIQRTLGDCLGLAHAGVHELLCRAVHKCTSTAFSLSATAAMSERFDKS